MMILKLQALCPGYSGIQEETVKRILWMIENDMCPAVPSQGSVGASGDLAPLAYLFLPLIGLGKILNNVVLGQPSKANDKEGTTEASILLKQHNLNELALGTKECLALITGTQFIDYHLTIRINRFLNCLDTADIIGAMSIEGYMGSSKPFDSRLHAIRPFPANKYVASRIESLLKTSEIE